MIHSSKMQQTMKINNLKEIYKLCQEETIVGYCEDSVWKAFNEILTKREKKNIIHICKPYTELKILYHNKFQNIRNQIHKKA